MSRALGVMFCAALSTLSGCKTATEELLSRDIPPKTVLVRDLNRCTKSDATGVVLDKIVPLCERGAKQAEITVKLQATAFRPVDSDAEKVDFSYFIAVADAAGQIIQKQDHKTSIHFDEKEWTTSEVLEEKISTPLSKEDSITNVAIYVGLNLEEKEIQQNRMRYKSIS